MKFAFHAMFATVITNLAIPAFAALPEQGYWSFDSELNGKPGRGLQIERQGGEIIILSYYGYRKDGSATFYQASGKLANQATFTADLFEYKNGPALGGPVQSGEISQKVGTVNIKFDTSQSGTIQFPGESEIAISRFVYADTERRLSNQFSVSFFGKDNYWGHPFSAKLTLSSTGKGLDAALASPSGVFCEYSGSLEREGSAFNSVGQITPCDQFFGTPNPLTYGRFMNLKVSDDGMLSGVYRSGPDENGPFRDYHVVGLCYGIEGAVITGSRPRPCTSKFLDLQASE